MDQPSYGGALAALAMQKPGGPPQVPTQTGPVAMAGPPPPTGIGAMPTGDAAMNNPRAASSETILALRKLKNHFPHAGDRIDGMISEIQGMSGKPTTPTMAPPTAPSPLNPMPVDDDPLAPPAV